jgi:hypothetical protein
MDSAVASTELGNDHNLPATTYNPTKMPGLASLNLLNGTSGNKFTYRDAIDVDEVRSHFPVLGGETIPFNNAAGTVVLKEAIERCFSHYLY